MKTFRQENVVIDSTELIRAASGKQGFSPKIVLDRVLSIGKQIFDYFVLEDKLIVGSFTSPSQIIIEDIKRMRSKAISSTVVGALAGCESDKEKLHSVVLRTLIL